MRRFARTAGPAKLTTGPRFAAQFVFGYPRIDGRADVVYPVDGASQVCQAPHAPGPDLPPACSHVNTGRCPAAIARQRAARHHDAERHGQAIARHHHGKVALYAKDIRTGKTVAINADVPVNTASVIKVAIMLEAMYQVKEGRASFDDVLQLAKEDQVSGSGVLLRFPPAQINLETALALMITQSDNTATNLVLARIGRENVNQRLRSLGLTLTTSIRPISRPKEGDQTPELKPFGIGRTTAREMARILESIDRCDLADPKLCAKMVDLMEHQFWRNCIPHYLEDADTTEVPSHMANKTGSLNHVRNDAGIVYTKNGPS